ncbi:HAD family hydrolase [Bariatricus sp. SGI.161]|uniref:HAD family hydrolase n=1 Tax=Bariatricus sp. SGI.161 TaxID=3420550 RepID=UPI003CFDC76D|nr:HAD-IA family hydrolase [bacterium]
MKKEDIKIIIFDMDGVVLDSEPLHENARKMMFEKWNIVPDESFPDAVGKSSSGFWRQVLALCNMEGDPYDFEAEQYGLVAMQIEKNHVQPSDGFKEVIEWAKANDMKIGLASSSTRVLVNDALQMLHVKDYFDYTVSGNEIKTKKPAPDAYLKVLELAGLPAECAIAVEDSGSGVKAAKNAGIFCYGYENPTSGNQDLSEADKIIKNLREIME